MTINGDADALFVCTELVKGSFMLMGTHDSCHDTIPNQKNSKKHTVHTVEQLQPGEFPEAVDLFFVEVA